MLVESAGRVRISQKYADLDVVSHPAVGEIGACEQRNLGVSDKHLGVQRRPAPTAVLNRPVPERGLISEGFERTRAGTAVGLLPPLPRQECT
jgi:hypothetical protein